jgi:hypothetical protein
MRQANAERNAQIYSRRNDGLTLAAIALEFELSQETIRLTVQQMDRREMWREIERNAQCARLAFLTRAAAVRAR